MAYLNRDLSINGVHAELSAVRNANAWWFYLMMQFGDEVFYIQSHKNGICAIDEVGKKVAFSKLKDFDYAENNKKALDHMLNDLAEKLQDNF